MSKPKKRRWICTQCGSGKLAPGRMAKMDPRRYCLTCSAAPEARALVPRTCPALDRKRAAKRATRAERAASARQRAASDPKSIATRLVAKYKKLPSWADDARSVRIKGIHKRDSPWESGHADIMRGQIHLTLGNLDAGWHALIIHEIAHVVAYRRGVLARDASLTYSHHGPIWRGACSDAMADIMGSSWVTEWGGYVSGDNARQFHETMVRAFIAWLKMNP